MPSVIHAPDTSFYRIVFDPCAGKASDKRIIGTQC